MSRKSSKPKRPLLNNFYDTATIHAQSRGQFRSQTAPGVQSVGRKQAPLCRARRRHCSIRQNRGATEASEKKGRGEGRDRAPTRSEERRVGKECRFRWS